MQHPKLIVPLVTAPTVTIEMKEGMAQLLTKADVCMKMDHCAEGSQGQESFHVWLDELEFHGIELTDSGEG